MPRVNDKEKESKSLVNLRNWKVEEKKQNKAKEVETETNKDKSISN